MYLCRRMFTVGLVVLASAILVAVSVAGARPASMLEDPPDPQPLPPTGIDWLDHIYYGAVPPQADQQPVLVFVHGLGRTAEDWWAENGDYGTNDMYLSAYHAGYRTAFVTLDLPESEPPRSIWDNGKTLDKQLKAIARHYRVDQFDIVAHSKGGIDAEVAIVYHDGWKRVRFVFTLGTPHWGAELVDLAYSDWAEWLAELLGVLCDGTYCLQTGYMRLFRTATDRRSEDDAVGYHTGAGTEWGPEDLALWLGGLYLSQFGPNDGFVTVASTELPGARILFVEPYNHFNIHMGSTSFPWIDAVLREAELYRIYLPIISSDVGAQNRFGAGRQETNPPLESGVILRGGSLSGSAIEVVPVEPRVRVAAFHLLVSEEAVTATLNGSDGLPRRLEAVAATDEGLFSTAFHWIHVATEPMAGEWTLRIDGPPGAAYLLVTTIESSLRVTLSGLPEQPVAPNSMLKLSAEADAVLGHPIVHQIEMHISRSLPGRGDNRIEVQSDPGPILDRAPSKEGIYVVSATVTGETAEGMAFERSFVRSFAVVKPETLRGQLTLLDR
jgi:pimeloyl-ACP methyl ester carboxylesterase